MAIEAKKAMRA